VINIAGFITVRNIKNNNYRDIIYEWEDEIINRNHMKLEYIRQTMRNRILNRIGLYDKFKMNKFDLKQSVYMAFVLSPKELFFISRYNCIPVFIDVWPKEIDFVCKKMGLNPFVVTSYDIFQLIKERGYNVIYVPLSIADQWRLDKIHQKSLDIVQMGRKNQILHEYALKYVSKNKHIEYIYSDYDERSKQLFYYSTIRGKINSPETRIEYMDFLRKAKVCLISSPGMDQSRPCADGIDYPTPRFYETAINYCSMIGRYDSNHDEFEMTGIPKVCCNI